MEETEYPGYKETGAAGKQFSNTAQAAQRGVTI